MFSALFNSFSSLTGVPVALLVVSIAAIGVLAVLKFLVFSSPAVDDDAPSRGVLCNRGSEAATSERIDSSFMNYSAYHAAKDEEKTTAYGDMVRRFYSMVTDFYEYGWGQCFHFAAHRKGESFKDAIVRHEVRLIDELGLKPGMKVLDLGCGVGGPMRNVARISGANVTGITISEYQVERCKKHIAREGLQNLCEVVLGDFHQLPFADNTFDAVMIVEAACHSPQPERLYREVLRVLRPGGKMASYEWVVLKPYQEDNKEHVRVIKGIELGNGLPALRHVDEIVPIGERAGLEFVRMQDVAETCDKETPWYTPLQRGRFSYWITHAIVKTLEFIRWAPKGTADVSTLLMNTALDLTAGGKLGIFSPMVLYTFAKPQH